MSPIQIEFHPGAIKEARTAYRWYLRRSAAAAGRFKAALEAAIDQVIESPERWPTYLHGTRCRLLRRCRFLVVYRQQGERLQVVAVAHGERRPGYWKRRNFEAE